METFSGKRFFATAFCFFIVFLGSASGEGPNDVLAQVGPIPITRFEVNREIQKIIPMQVSFHGGLPAEKLEDISRQAMETLVERARMAKYALDNEIAVANQDVEDRVAGYRNKFKTPEEFEKALGAVSFSDFRASIFRELLAEAAEKTAVEENIQVTPKDVRAFFEKHEDTYLRPRQFKASHIMIKVDPSSNKEEREILRQKADDLARQAQEGEDFYNLAYYNSDDRSRYVGGDLGYFHEGQTVAEFENALKGLKPGEIAGPIQTMYGFHIIKLVEDNPPKQLTFDEVKDKIRQSLVDKQREALTAEWKTLLEERYPVQMKES